MEGSFNAIGLLAMLIVTAYIIIRYGHLPTGIMQVVTGGAVAFALGIVLLVFTTHMCHSGNPVRQNAVTTLCFFTAWLSSAGHKDLIIARQAQKNFRRLLWFIPILGFVLSFEFMSIVHTDNYFGNLSYVDRGLRASREGQVKQFEGAMLIAQKDGIIEKQQRYPAGWLRESALMPHMLKLDSDVGKYCEGKSAAVYPLWHTWLTGLYGKRITRVELWYPGGRVEDAVGHLEFRPRHDAKAPG